MNKWLLLAMVPALVGGCRPAPTGDAPQASGYTVEWIGELRSVHLEGDARPRVHLREIEPLDGAFAIGPLAGLRGEITVVDGEAYIARADEAGEKVERGFDHDAPFLVFGRVAEWQPRPVPADVPNVEALERWLSTAAAEAGLRKDEAFPFKLETSESTLEYHVIANDEPGDRVTRPHRELMRFFTLGGEPVTLLGVYSESHGGVFTHHGQATHIHMVSRDGRRSGHVDGLELASDAIAYLPIP